VVETNIIIPRKQTGGGKDTVTNFSEEAKQNNSANISHQKKYIASAGAEVDM